MDTISTCCNAPVTYQGTRLINGPCPGDFQAAETHTCTACGNECELDYIETEEDHAEARAEYWMDSERNGD